MRDTGSRPVEIVRCIRRKVLLTLVGHDEE
jgi:hypothetical protein